MAMKRHQEELRAPSPAPFIHMKNPSGIDRHAEKFATSLLHPGGPRPSSAHAVECLFGSARRLPSRTSPDDGDFKQ